MRVLVHLPIALLTLILGAVAAGESARDWHREWGHGALVALWLLLPLCALLPLKAGWDSIRRKTLATLCMLTGVVGTAALTLLESFTGHLIGGLLQQPPPVGQAKDSLLRMKALHFLGVPLLLAIALALVWAVTFRLSRRIAAPPASGDK